MAARRGFTLIELLVVVTIMLILVAMTVTAINFTLDSERTRSASRQVQSYLEGARSRAIYQKQNVGVRFLVDQTTNLDGRQVTVSSMVFIAQSPPIGSESGDGRILLQRQDLDTDGVADVTNGPVTVVRGAVGTLWWDLAQRGLLYNGSKITIISPDGSEATHAVLTNLLGPNVDQQLLILAVPYRATGNETAGTLVNAYGGNGPTEYRLEMPMTVLPGEEPVLLPQGTVIDLDYSKLPASWGPYSEDTYLGVGNSGYLNGSLDAGEDQNGNGALDYFYSPFMDIVFTPRGTVHGSTVSAGVVHLLITDKNDSDAGVPIDALQWNSGATYGPGNPAGTPMNPTRALPSWVIPTTASGGRNGFAYRCTSGTGSPGSSEPVWPVRTGETVTDGSITWTAFPIHDKLLVSIFAQTGAVTATQVYQYDASLNAAAYPDPYRYAETGK